MDIYKDKRPNETQSHYVKVGRSVSLLALVIAMITAKPLLGNFDQAFQYIQEFTGFFTPGICALFILGMFWKKTTANGGLLAALGSFVLSIVFRQFWPELPFIDRVGIVFVLCIALAVVVSLLEKKGVHENAVHLDEVQFHTTRGFNIAAIAVIFILIAFYTAWW
jgi:SSS family solute:Na+ symporter